MSGAVATIDLDAVARNTRAMRAMSPSAVMAVVKADAFGHGAIDVARAALGAGATWLGVTSVDEGLELREAGIDAPVLSWLNGPDAPWADALAAGIEVAVSSARQVEAVAAAAINKGIPARVHLNADTGMAREGAPASQWDTLCTTVAELGRSGAVRLTGIMGHLPCADQQGHPATATSVRQFESACAVAAAHVPDASPRNHTHASRGGRGVAPLRHLAASAAVLGRAPIPVYDLVRIGAALVGIDSFGTGLVEQAMTLRAPVIAVNKAVAGTPVGYGHTEAVATDTHLALLPVGYADGIPVAASGRAWVWLAGRAARIVGRVSMDSIVVDAGPVAPPLGELATVFGSGALGEPTVADWAGWSGTLPHEILTGIGPRVRRVTLPAAQAETPRDTRELAGVGR